MADDGKSTEMKGRLKEAGGAVTGDDEMAREGRSDQRQGKMEQAADKVKDAARDAGDALRR
ncbi:MAG TPA: CsbD family protein [Miltoncostaeaceae bacterium]|nr:CsbD family protein [Miltoncostaeaceae bacterium]